MRVEVLQRSDGLKDIRHVSVELLHGPERVAWTCALKSCSTVTASKPSGVCLSMFSTAGGVYMDLRVEILQLSDGLEDNERVPVEVLHGPERVGVDLRVEVLQGSDGLKDIRHVPVEVLHGPERVGIDLRAKPCSAVTDADEAALPTTIILLKLAEPDKESSTAQSVWHRLAR